MRNVIFKKEMCSLTSYNFKEKANCIPLDLVLPVDLYESALLKGIQEFLKTVTENLQA